MHVKIYRMALTNLPSHGQIFRDENAFDDFNDTSEKGMNRFMQTFFSPSVPEGSVLMYSGNFKFRRFLVNNTCLISKQYRINELRDDLYILINHTIIMNARYVSSVLALAAISDKYVYLSLN